MRRHPSAIHQGSSAPKRRDTRTSNFNFFDALASDEDGVAAALRFLVASIARTFAEPVTEQSFAITIPSREWVLRVGQEA